MSHTFCISLQLSLWIFGWLPPQRRRSRCPAPSFLALCFVFRAFAFSRAQTGRLRNYCRTDIEVAALPLITNYNGPQLLVPHFAFASCVCAFTVLLPQIFPVPLIVYSSHMQIGGSCCPRLHQHRSYCQQSWSLLWLQWLLPMWVNVEYALPFHIHMWGLLLHIKVAFCDY